MNLDKNKSFCILPFIHLSVVGTKIKPCCRFSPESNLVKKFSKDSKSKLSVKDILHSKEYDALRKKMLEGKSVKGCYKCYLEERSGGSSIRQGSYGDFKHLLSPDHKPNLRFLEIGFSNICNLKCRSCSSVLSTAWSKDEEKITGKHERHILSPKKKDRNTINFSDDDLKNLEHIKFVGGEPMLNTEFPRFLEQLSKTKVSKKCTVELFTNVSYFPDKKIIENLNLFKGARIHLSIDAYGKQNEYLRHPSEWNKVDLAVTKWLELRKNNSSISIQIEITASVYNILNLEKLLDWWIEKNKEIKNDEYRVHMIFVFYPEYLSLRNIPQNLKKEIAKTLKKLIVKYNDYSNIIYWIRNIQLTMMENGKDKLSEFLSFTKDLDDLRNENFAKTFPELNMLINKHL